MTNVSISELKAKPSKVISASENYPIAIKNRNKTKAYLVGKDIFEKMVEFVENALDREAIKNTDFSKGRDLEEVLEELGL